MKFNKYLPLETREFLEKQYKEYIRETPMTKKEQRVLRELEQQQVALQGGMPSI